MKSTALLSHLLAMSIITIIMLPIYISMQQIYRTGLDDPQVQLVQDVGSGIKKGLAFENLVPRDTVNIDHSLRPFLVAYNGEGQPLNSTGYLDGKMAKLPFGVLDYTRKNHDHRVTWEPRKGVRMAMVIEYINTSAIAFIAAGRSMAEVESRSLSMTSLLFKAWLLSISLVIIFAIMQMYFSKRVLKI